MGALMAPILAKQSVIAAVEQSPRTRHEVPNDVSIKYSGKSGLGREVPMFENEISIKEN